MIIIQNKIIKKANKKYCEIIGYPHEEIIGKNYRFNNPHSDLNEDIVDAKYNSIENKINSLDSIDFSIYNKITNKRHYLHTTIYPTLYQGERAVHGYFEDVTEKIEIEKEAIQLQDHLYDIQEISGFALTYSEDNEFKWTSEIYKIIEREPKESDKHMNILNEYIHFEDKEILNNAYEKLSPNNPSFNVDFRIITAKNNIKYITMFVKITYENNRIIKRTNFIQDISEHKKREIEFKELSDERGILLKEVHDRVKNNLQIILSLVDLDSRYNNYPEKITKDLKSRIISMSLIHKQMYDSETFSVINIKEYIKKFVKNLLHNYNPNVKCIFNIDETLININTAIPLGLIINEILINAMKIVYPHKKNGTLNIRLKSNEDKINLIIETEEEIINKENIKNNNEELSMIIVELLVSQIDGEINRLNKSNFYFELDFINK